MTNPNTALQAFAFDSHAVRVVMIDESPWFVAKDVCNCLEITNHRNALTRLDDDEKGVQTLDTLGGAQQISVINESGLYSLILRSQGATTPGTPTHTFRKWVTAEVLPSIRKIGSYAAPNSQVAQMDRLLRLIEEQLVQNKAIIEIATSALKPKPPRKPNRPISPEETAQALEWKAQGMSQNEIARQLNRSTGTVSYMIRGLRHD